MTKILLLPAVISLEISALLCVFASWLLSFPAALLIFLGEGVAGVADRIEQTGRGLHEAAERSATHLHR